MQTLKNLVALGLALSVSGMAHAAGDLTESIAFTTSGAVTVPGTLLTGQFATLGSCSKPHQAQGLCAESVVFQTTTAGTLTVTATDSPDVDNLAYVFQAGVQNAGLGVVTGYNKKGSFKVVDSEFALGHKEKLTLGFESPVSLQSMVVFPNDRNVHHVTKELDRFDGFSVSVDGGPFVEYVFADGNKVNFCTAVGKHHNGKSCHSHAKYAGVQCGPLKGKTFTFGYAIKKSGERYYIGGIEFKSEGSGEEVIIE